MIALQGAGTPAYDQKLWGNHFASLQVQVEKNANQAGDKTVWIDLLKGLVPCILHRPCHLSEARRGDVAQSGWRCSSDDGDIQCLIDRLREFPRDPSVEQSIV